MRYILAALVLLITPCYAQETYGPEYIPEYVLEESDPFPRPRYDFSESVVPSSIHRDTLQYNPITASESLTEILRRNSDLADDLQGCLILPFPIDDYYMGCYFQFDPNTEDHRVDIWD